MIRHCEHVKTNGHFCGSPAMRGRNYCFYHLNVAGHRMRAQQLAARDEGYLPELPLLEDAASIQVALMQVNEWLLRGVIDYKRAGLLLYSLQTASCNLRNIQKEAEAEAGNAVCNRYDSFEQDYDLDEQAAASLGIDDAAAEETLDAKAAEIVEGAKYAGLIADDANQKLAEDADADDPSADGDSDAIPTDQPVNVLDRDYADRRVRIPLTLSPVQYEQAKVSIFGYEMLNGIDRETGKSRKAIAQRPALSQKIFMGARKPPVSVSVTGDSGELAVGK